MLTTIRHQRCTLAALISVAIGLFASLLIVTSLIIFLVNHPSYDGPPPKIERNSSGYIVPYDDPEDANVVSNWQKVQIIDSHHATITFGTSPMKACDRIGAQVTETDQAVTVALSYGRVRNAKKVCKNENKLVDMMYDAESVIVETKGPIGDRPIVNAGRTTTGTEPIALSPIHDMTNEQLTKPQYVELIDDRTARVHFTAKIDSCHGYRPEISVGKATYVIQIHEGSPRGATDKQCQGTDRDATMIVHLPDAVDDRLLAEHLR